MSAGLSSKQRTDRTYKFLKGIQRELSKAGVSTEYKRAWPHCSAHLHNAGFVISLSWSSASNGETFGFSRIAIGQEVYGLGETSGRFEQGMKRIKELFGPVPVPKAYTDGSVMIVLPVGGAQ
jgi:hypothetical protein